MPKIYLIDRYLVVRTISTTASSPLFSERDDCHAKNCNQYISFCGINNTLSFPDLQNSQSCQHEVMQKKPHAFHLDLILFQTHEDTVLYSVLQHSETTLRRMCWFKTTKSLKKIHVPLSDSHKFACILFSMSLPDIRWNNLHGKTYLYFESKMEWCLDFNICWIGMKCHVFTCSCFIMFFNISLKTFVILYLLNYMLLSLLIEFYLS